VDDEDVEGLRASIDGHDNFDQVALAQRLEKHELLELRRVAALLYKRNKRWDASIALSKQDAQYKDAVDTAAESKDGALAEGLLGFFIGKGDKEAFTATLYTCYSLIRADVAMELAWRHRMTDSVMPFMIQYIRDINGKLATLEARTKPQEGKADHDAATAAAMEAAGFNPYMGPQGVLAIADVAYNPQTGYAGMPAYGAAGAMPAPGYGVPGMGGVAPGYGYPGQHY
jgi:clathrin heavy chain